MSLYLATLQSFIFILLIIRTTVCYAKDNVSSTKLFTNIIIKSNRNVPLKMDVSIIQKIIRDNLFTLLEKCPGRKVIVWDDSVWGPVRLLVPNLQQYDVCKIYQLGRNFTFSFPADIENVIFIARPKLSHMDLIAEIVHGDTSRSSRVIHTSKQVQRKYHLFFVSRDSLLCRKRLENTGVLGSFQVIAEFACYLFPFDTDLMTMEMPELFREVIIENDPTALYEVAQAIVFIQQCYGKIPQIWGKGHMAKQVWDMVQRLQNDSISTFSQPRQLPSSQRNKPRSHIDQIVLIDRSIDLVSPLATQLTYEGLIDELFEIKNATAQFPANRFHMDDDKQQQMEASLAGVDEKKEIFLTSSEPLYADLRDKNFTGVGAYLSRQAKDISGQLEDRHGKSIAEIKVLVQSLRMLLDRKKAVSHHTTIAECVKEVTDTWAFLDGLQTEQEMLNCIEVDKVSSYIEDLIAQRQPLHRVLRLICLQCSVNSGLKPRTLDHYRREIMQVYGLTTALPALSRLERAGVLRAQTSVRAYTVLRKALRLTTEDISELNPTDISYVHSVYAPLTVRVIEQLITKQQAGIRQLQDVLGLLPGPKFETTQYVEQLLHRGNAVSGQEGAAVVMPTVADRPKVVLVFFIGGCTFAEISAIRFLSQEEDSNVEFTVATTKLINGNTFIQSIIDK